MQEKINYYDKFTECLKNVEHFTYVRYNDGELDLIFQNGNGYEHIVRRWDDEIKEESKRLKSIFTKKLDYYIGICDGYMRNKSELIYSSIHQETKIIPTNIFHITEINKLKEFTELLEKRDTILVGPAYLNKLNFYNKHVITPIEYVWKYTDRISSEILNLTKEMNNPVILFCCSIATNIIADHIFDIIGSEITQIDIGSTFDPFCGFFSRTGHKEIMSRYNIPIDRNIKKEIYQKKRKK